MKTELDNETQKMRIDVALVSRGLVATRARAVRLLEAGQIFVETSLGGDRVQIRRPATLVGPQQSIFIVDGEANRFVSRAGLKLESALEFFNIDVMGQVALDVGISTGGFTDCLLQRGIKKVVGIDVGHHQLDSKLRQDARVEFYEGVNARDLSKFGWLGPFDIIVVDVSFISLTKVIPEVIKFLGSPGKLVALVKPQFELGAQFLNKKGVVRHGVDFMGLKNRFFVLFEKLGLQVEGVFECPILGGDGNKEFFIYGKSK